MTAKGNSGVTHLVDRKDSWRREYPKLLCGVSNSDGATLISTERKKLQPTANKETQS